MTSKRTTPVLLLTITLLTPTALTAIVPAVQAPPALTTVTINSGAGDQYDPHVSGDWVAYTDGVGIRYYNFATNVDAAIPLDGAARDLLSDVSGSRIVFSRVIVGVKTAVMVFDAATVGPAIEVDPAPSTTRFGAAIGGNTVAYIDFGLEGNGELVISDLSTLVSTRITNDTAVDGNPSVSPDGNVVVWEHCLTSLTSCDIYETVKKSSGLWTTSAVAFSTSPEGNPDSNGTLVVYDSQRGGNSDIFWRPVAGGAESQLELAGVERNPSIAGPYIAFESAASIFDTSDIFVYDTVNNRLFQITDTPFVTEQLNDITMLPDCSLRVVWASDEDVDTRNIKAATFQLAPCSTTIAAAIQAPINADGSSVFNAKRGVVPVKFSLTANGAGTCQLPAATIVVARTAGGTLGTINEADFTQPSDTGSAFRIDSATCQYVYNLAAGSLGAGTYLVQITVGGVAVGSATFSLN